MVFLACFSVLFASQNKGFVPKPNVLPPQGRIIGDLRLIPNFPSKILGNSRTIRVWLPPGYGQNRNQHYPVLYMDDGQNIFDATLSVFSHREWRCDETAFALIKSKLIKPLIIVGIDSIDRNNELLPVFNSRYKFGGLADKYDDFVIDEVKTYVDRHYRTKPDRKDTFMGGSSFGGINSLYMGLTHADTFSKLLIVSPAFLGNNDPMFALLSNIKHKLPLKIWVDIGTEEDGTKPYPVDHAKKLVSILESKGWKLGKNLAFFVDYGAHHCEQYWARRFGMMLLFIDRK